MVLLSLGTSLAEKNSFITLITAGAEQPNQLQHRPEEWTENLWVSKALVTETNLEILKTQT